MVYTLSNTLPLSLRLFEPAAVPHPEFAMIFFPSFRRSLVSQLIAVYYSMSLLSIVMIVASSCSAVHLTTKFESCY
jgi:hypothetical protein